MSYQGSSYHIPQWTIADRLRKARIAADLTQREHFSGLIRTWVLTRNRKPAYLWPVTTPDLLTAEQAAAAVGVNRRTITKWAETGRLPVALKTPGATGMNLFRQADVDRLAAERRAELEAELAALAAPASAGSGEGGPEA